MKPRLEFHPVDMAPGQTHIFETRHGGEKIFKAQRLVIPNEIAHSFAVLGWFFDDAEFHTPNTPLPAQMFSEFASSLTAYPNLPHPIGEGKLGLQVKNISEHASPFFAVLYGEVLP